MNEIENIINNQEYREIDIEIGEMLKSLSKNSSDELVLLGAAISYAISLGDSCIYFEDLNKLYDYNWEEFLKSQENICSFNRENTILPIIVDGNKLYFQRYFTFEREIEKEIISRLNQKVEIQTLPKKLSELNAFFKLSSEKLEMDYQMLAVFMAFYSSFFIISGGPGTGKTTVISSLIALEVLRDNKIKIALCAPTGKAQNRMKESIDDSLKYINIEENFKQQIRDFSCSTIHSLISHCPTGEKLPYDLIIVDECSMIALELGARLFRVIPKSCRVIFLGDKDQLASVESGAILGDICQNTKVNNFSKKLQDAFYKETNWLIPQEPNENGYLAELQINHRFKDAKDITNMANAIAHMQDNIDETMHQINIITENADKDKFNIVDVKPKDFRDKLNFIFINNYLKIKQLSELGGEDNLKTAFDIMKKFKILCAVREGEFGCKNLNNIAREILGFNNNKGKYQAGMLLMVTQNDYSKSLFNGDCGIVWRNKNKELSVYFDVERCYSLAELPEHEDVFAMTVHKSQGSGFEKVLFILPEEESVICTKELVYTAVTRAEKELIIWANNNVLQTSLNKKNQRKTGLFK